MMSILRGINGALSLLTTLPTLNTYPQQPGQAYAYFPLIGVLIGSVLWLTYTLSRAVMSTDGSAFVVLLVWVLVTGGLHLDGFGDACDGLFAQVDPDRRLEIMKDSRAGSWAVVGLVMLLLGKWIALRGIDPSALIIAAATGRWVMVVAAVAFPYARTSGMGGYFRQGLGLPQIAFSTATLLAVTVFFGQHALMILGSLVIVGIVAFWASRRLGGGLTGDSYGALCELTEVLILFALNSA